MKCTSNYKLFQFYLYGKEYKTCNEIYTRMYVYTYHGCVLYVVHGLEVDEKPNVFRCCPELIKTEVPEINFDVLPHNFCNHRRSMTNEKYHSVSFIILDRIDYLSRRTYRPLIEDQYKQLRPVFLDFKQTSSHRTHTNSRQKP